MGLSPSVGGDVPLSGDRVSHVGLREETLRLIVTVVVACLLGFRKIID